MPTVFLPDALQVFYRLSQSLSAGLQDLSSLILVRTLVQALFSPLSGYIGDRYDRTMVVAGGSLLWAIFTSTMGLSASTAQALISSALNGIGLALVLPCVQSLIADCSPQDARGRAFGFMAFTSSVGGMFGSFFATNIAGMTLSTRNIEGWRFSFQLMALVSLLTSYLVYKYAEEPRKQMKENIVIKASAMKNLQTAWVDFASVLTIPSFQILMLQGCIGSIPWSALSMLTVWLQLLGFSDLQASSLTATFSSGCAIGVFVGGYFGDKASKLHRTGRVFVNQFSVAVGLPLTYLLLKQIPSDKSNVSDQIFSYGMVLLLMGLTVSWCGPNNNALFAELVPEAKRSSIYALDRSIEGSIAAFGHPLVGVLAARFGFRGVVGGRDATGNRNADALAMALLCTLIIPWTMCGLSFTLLHWTYLKDKAAAKVEDKLRKQRNSAVSLVEMMDASEVADKGTRKRG